MGLTTKSASEQWGGMIAGAGQDNEARLAIPREDANRMVAEEAAQAIAVQFQNSLKNFDSQPSNDGSNGGGKKTRGGRAA